MPDPFYFKLDTPFKPAGDQPEAIGTLVRGLEKKSPHQVLLGVTGSGKTFTMANVIQAVQKPTLVISHNKTLAGQLYSEFKSFFPDNAVEYFISYYDYYLPESYIPQTDTYIAKDSSVNDEIERFRLSATTSLMTRNDVIIVASVSCIYGLGSPEDYEMMSISLKKGLKISRRELTSRLVDIQYERNDTAPEGGQFRIRGDVIDVFSPHKNEILRIELWDDTVEDIGLYHTVTAKKTQSLENIVIPPVKHFVLPKSKILAAEQTIEDELKERVKYFEQNNKLVEAQRIYQRTKYDLEMLKEIGYCSGIENYSRHLSGRPSGSRPYCLIDYFPDDFLLFIDESHASIPQLRAMYNADRSRKQVLVDYGFRLPSALDNRPLSFEEFNQMAKNTIYVSATPADYELNISSSVAEQIVRPTGLLDPEIVLKPLEGQIDDVIAEVRERTKSNERTLVTTLTKKSSEKLADYLQSIGIRAKYLHSEIDALKRIEILSALRKADFDCLIGVNLLREGLDLPEVSLVAILDADKEGFLRSERAIMQVAGRAARNVNGKVILYADRLTDSIKSVVDTTNKRRAKQIEYNKKHGIVPKTITKEIRTDLFSTAGEESKPVSALFESRAGYETQDVEDTIFFLQQEMLEAASKLEFERAALLRDKIAELKKQ